MNLNGFPCHSSDHLSYGITTVLLSVVKKKHELLSSVTSLPKKMPENGHGSTTMVSITIILVSSFFLMFCFEIFAKSYKLHNLGLKRGEERQDSEVINQNQGMTSERTLNIRNMTISDCYL